MFLFLEKSNHCLCSVTQIPIVPATLLLHCKTIGSYDGSWHEIDYAIGETIKPPINHRCAPRDFGRLPELVSKTAVASRLASH